LPSFNLKDIKPPIMIWIILSMFSSVVFAQFSGEALLTSNFIWRGTTFTNNKPAVQADINYQLPFEHYLGFFASNAEFSDQAMGKNTEVNHEVDVYFSKRITRGGLEIDFTYAYFTFGDAWFFNTDEWNIKFHYKKWELELSYMDDYFGYQGSYRYIRLGHEFELSSTESLRLYLGYNHFANRKGSFKERCSNASCSERAYGLSGAASSHYVDGYFAFRRKLLEGLVLELAYNYTNRDEYTYDGSSITREDAQDSMFFVSMIHEF
jgi:uncharacterized protein (TIGR02001 family)